MILQPTNMVDISEARRMLGLLNGLRNFGFVLAGFLLILSVGDQRLLIALTIFFIANVLLAKGSQMAAVVLVLVALGMGVYFENEYRSVLERVEIKAATESGPNGSVHQRGAIQDLIALNRILALYRILALFSVGVSIIYLGGVGIVWGYRRRVPQLKSQLRWAQRLTLQAAILRAQMTPKAIIYFGLAITCFLIALGPWLVTLVAFLLHIKLSGAFATIRDWLAPSWLNLVLILVCVISGLNFLVRAKRYGARSSMSARTLDSRRPILLLRSFQDDMTPLERTNDQNAWMRSALVPSRWTLEETIEQLLGVHGPVIAIGRPGEALPPAGVAREYVSNNYWQERVRDLIGQAQAIVVVLGDTEGLKFEYQTLVNMDAYSKMILVFPPHKPEKLASIWHRFVEVAVPEGSAFTADVSRALTAHFTVDGATNIITCQRHNDEDSYRLGLQYCLAQVNLVR